MTKLRFLKDIRCMTDATTYVVTQDAKTAVSGREPEILDAMGINWRNGRPHIHCPYPQHDDADPSWRWDERQALAHCTCSQGLTIFDVMMKMESIDFDAAKLRAVELLDRRGLIRERSDERRIQATDAESLLNASAQDRDDQLPANYLGHRLQVPSPLIVMPTTPVVGIRALGYFDAPAPAKGRGRPPKPTHVGDFACAVFGTVDADSNRHAHRIYLSPGGAGKAELGVTADGFPRDPKKSARILDGRSTAGRAVLWGDPNQSPSILVCEGIETGAALAFAFSSEIEAGEITVAAAISAVGVEAFKPWPATQYLFICADRDEATKPSGKPGSRRGETAARKLALKCYRELSVFIALPGASDESVDWLDIHVRGGFEAVRNGVKAAKRFAPSEAELGGNAAIAERQAKLEEIARNYPLPSLDTLKLAYRPTRSGEIKVHKSAGIDIDPVTGNSSERWVPIATPFGVPARLRYVDQGNDYGLRVAVQDMGGQLREVDLDRAGLAKMIGSDSRSRFFAAGLRTEADGDLVAIQCLKAAAPDVEIVIVNQPGWHALNDSQEPVFVCPDGSIIGRPHGLIIELAKSSRMAPDVARGGSLNEWKSAAAAALAADRVPHWTLGVIAGFAGPILSLTGLDTCGINLSGMSSGGKSTAQRLATSAWSTSDVRRPGLYQSARATDNAIEALAARATGTVLSLDELGHVSGKIAARMIYTIAGGVGKKRMTADATMRDGFTWSTFAILSGECSLAEKIRSDGEEWVAGMAVRIVDIDVTDINRQIDQDVLQRIGAINVHYGHAGPEFVRTLLEAGYHQHAGDLRDEILRAARALAGDGADSPKIRAATPFALLQIVGNLAREFKLIPETTDIAGAVTWGWQRFCQSADAMALEPEAQAFANIRAWVAERWNVTIKPVAFEGGINNREAVAWYDEDTVYLPRERLREAAGGVLKENAIANTLDQQNLLMRRDDRSRRYVRHVPKVGKVAAYALKRSEFGRTEMVRDPDRFRVIEGSAPELDGAFRERPQA
jgi:hypothetical protein